MSLIGSAAGILGSAAGAPLSQTAGAAAERSQKESAAVQRLIEAEQNAELAGGIGQTEEDSEADERDADGRRLWEKTPRQPEPSSEPAFEGAQRSKDATGTAGNSLDLVG